MPLIIADAPARARDSARPGQTSDARAELRDVMPTLLELAGVAVPDTVDGRSLADLITTTSETGAGHREWLHGEHVYWGQSLHWMTDGRFKYVWGAGEGTEQLFDLAVDPGETHDLVAAGGAPDDLQRCRDALIEALRGRPEGFVEDGSLVTGRPVSEVLPHLRERLAARGAPVA